MEAEKVHQEKVARTIQQKQLQQNLRAELLMQLTYL